MRNRFAAAALLLLLAGCGGNTPSPSPAPSPQPIAPQPSTAAAPDEHAIATVRVDVSTLNVRADASTSSEIVNHVRRGQRLAVLADNGNWLRVKLSDGTTGWVSSELVVREGAATRPRRSGCPPDSDYSFVTTPKPSFSESGPHGMVVIEANVDARGIVNTTRVVSNDTRDDALAFLAEREIRNARFNPPVRNCTARAFVFTYKRAF